MPIAASQVVKNVVTTLQDSTNVRWTVAELVGYLNDGQREIAVYRPDAMVKTAALALVAGTRQQLPADGQKLVDVVRNTANNKRAVRMVSREILDAQVPNWHNLAGVAEIKHFIYDVREPKVFYVYPPALNTASLEIIYAGAPTDIAIPADGAVPGDVVGNISVSDLLANVLQDYILFRAYAKDAEYTANSDRAKSYYTLYTSGLGVEVKATVAMAPSAKGNPNVVSTPAAQVQQ